VSVYLRIFYVYIFCILRTFETFQRPPAYVTLPPQVATILGTDSAGGGAVVEPGMLDRIRCATNEPPLLLSLTIDFKKFRKRTLT
jgi:hypothetical protein